MREEAAQGGGAMRSYARHVLGSIQQRGEPLRIEPQSATSAKLTRMTILHSAIYNQGSAYPVEMHTYLQTLEAIDISARARTHPSGSYSRC